MKPVTKLSPAGFRYWQHNGHQVVALPNNLITHGANKVDISRLTNDPRELAYLIEYRLCEMMAMSGFSHRAMSNVLGLSEGAIAHRIKKVGIKIRDYRDGNSPLAKQVIKRLDQVAQHKLVENLQKHLLK